MPYNNPIKKNGSSCTRMYDSKGKPAGLMAEGSMAYMESIGQEKSNLMQDMPIDNRGVGEMSPYKMDHGSAMHHSGKSKLHAKPEKNYPDDGHLHYQGGKKVESPGVSETKKLSDTSGGVGQMSPYKFTGMSGGSAMHQEDPNQKDKKKKLTEAEYIDRELTKRMKKKKMTPEEVLAETKSIKGLYKQLNLGNN
jgi:hypothetical protein